MGTFNQMTSKINRSPAIIGVFVVFLTLLVISLVLTVEDFNTSLLGYQMIPTAKSNDMLPWFVAGLPQLIQIALAYVAIEKKNPWYLAVAIIAFMADMSTDVYFKSYGGQTWALVWVASLESLILYTLGSEILLVFSLGILHALLPKVNGYVMGKNKAKASSRDGMGQF